LSARASNGSSRRWTVEKGDGFAADQERLVSAYPRLEDVFSVTERQLEAIPTYRAIELGQDRWLYVTHVAFDAPSMVLFYEIEPIERTVSLLGVDLNE
jgi:hypothetical protein